MNEMNLQTPLSKISEINQLIYIKIIIILKKQNIIIIKKILIYFH